MAGADRLPDPLAGGDILGLARLADDGDGLDLGLRLLGCGFELGERPGALPTPSATACPISTAVVALRASAATPTLSCLAPSARARLAATAAARRMLVRVTSAGLPIPTSRMRCVLPPAGYRRLVSSRFPEKSPLAIARPSTPPPA